MCIILLMSKIAYTRQWLSCFQTWKLYWQINVCQVRNDGSLPVRKLYCRYRSAHENKNHRVDSWSTAPAYICPSIDWLTWSGRDASKVCHKPLFPHLPNGFPICMSSQCNITSCIRIGLIQQVSAVRCTAILTASGQQVLRAQSISQPLQSL